MWIAIILILAVLAMLTLLLVPRGANTDDGPLPPDIEARLLLGEPPEEIDGSARERKPNDGPGGP
jgi:hypothetical protein